MRLLVLLDRDTADHRSGLLREAGHDVTRVVEEPSHCEVVADREMLEYARGRGRFAITHDRDFTLFDPDDHSGVCYVQSNGCGHRERRLHRRGIDFLSSS